MMWIQFVLNIFEVSVCDFIVCFDVLTLAVWFVNSLANLIKLEIYFVLDIKNIMTCNLTTWAINAKRFVLFGCFAAI